MMLPDMTAALHMRSYIPGLYPVSIAKQLADMLQERLVSTEHVSLGTIVMRHLQLLSDTPNGICGSYLTYTALYAAPV